LPNIKACISHTYNKAMAFRNQLIEEDGSFSTNQIVNIDEDQVIHYHIYKTIVGNIFVKILSERLITNYAKDLGYYLQRKRFNRHVVDRIFMGIDIRAGIRVLLI
jgi:hypothetical protein